MPASLLAVLVLASCGSSGVTVKESAGHSTIVSNTENPETAWQALLEGVLVDGPGGCLSVEGTNPPTYLMVFPHGTTIDGDSLSVPGLDPIRIGQQVAFGGGVSRSSELRDVVPNNCQTDHVWLANPGGE